MNRSKIKSPAQLQRTGKMLVFFCGAGLILFHMIVSSYKNALPRLKAFRHADEWLGLLFLIVVLAYLLFTYFAYPQMRPGYKKAIKKFNSYEYLFCFFLVFWYALSCALHKYYTGTMAFKSNDWWLYITWLMSFVVFPFARIIGIKETKKYVDPMLKIVLIPHIIFFAWLLWNYFHMNYVTLPSGSALEMTEGPGLAAGENRNNTASTALAMIGLCWYMFFTQKSWRRVPYVFGIAVYMAVLILTNSRTSWYASLVMNSIVVFRSVWFSLRSKKQVMRILVGAACTGACIFLLHGLRGELFELLDQATNFTGNNTALVQSSVEKQNNIVTWGNSQYELSTLRSTIAADTGSYPVELKDASEYARSASGGSMSRIRIYKACLKVMFSRKYIFLFGVTHADVPRTIYGLFGIDKIYSDAHNYWLQMGVAFGVPMMLEALVFTVFLIIRSLQILFCEKDEPFDGAWTTAVLVLSTFVFELTETQISSGSQIICPAFYLFAGWIVAMDLDRKNKMKKEAKSI